MYTDEKGDCVLSAMAESTGELDESQGGIAIVGS